MVSSRLLHRNLSGQEGVAQYIKHAEWEKYVAKSNLSSKVVIHNRRREGFPDKN